MQIAARAAVLVMFWALPVAGPAGADAPPATEQPSANPPGIVAEDLAARLQLNAEQRARFAQIRSAHDAETASIAAALASGELSSEEAAGRQLEARLKLFASLQTVLSDAQRSRLQEIQRTFAEDPQAAMVSSYLDRMSARLALTDEQRDEIRPLLDAFFGELSSLRARSDRSRTDGAQMLRDLQRSRLRMDARVLALLGPDQKATYKTMRLEENRELRERMRSRAGRY